MMMTYYLCFLIQLLEPVRDFHFKGFNVRGVAIIVLPIRKTEIEVP